MLQFEDVKECGFIHESLLKRFMGKGLTFEQVMTKPVPNYYTKEFKEIGFRARLLCAYSKKNDKFKKDIEGVMFDFICSYLDNESYAPFIAESQKLKAYFIDGNKKDKYTHYSQIAKKLNVGSSPMWNRYQAIESYNWFVHEGTAFTSFVNCLKDKKAFIKAVYDKFGYTAPEMRITHIY